MTTSDLSLCAFRNFSASDTNESFDSTKAASTKVPSTSVAAPSARTTSLVALNGYVPDGFTKESYAKFKANEAKKKAKAKNLGGMGPKGFKSRSFQSFQEALERGEASHLMPVMNAKERVRKGELKPEDIPVSDDSFLKRRVHFRCLLFF